MPASSSIRLWLDLFLQAASAPFHARTIPGCEPEARVAQVSVCPPAPRLVGIETNPGPVPGARARKKKKNPTSAARVAAASAPVARAAAAAASAAVAAVQAKPKAKKKKRSAQRPRGLSGYVLSLRDPWTCAPVRLGWGCFSKTSLRTLFGRESYGAGAGITTFAYVFDPSSNVGAAAGAGLAGTLHRYVATGSAALLGAQINSITGYSNSANYLAAVQDERIVSASLRVQVRWPSGQARGVLYALWLPTETLNNIELMSVDTLSALLDTVPAHATAAGEIGIDVSYRPNDSQSFQFSTTGNLPVTSAGGKMVVFGTGWTAASFAVDTFFICHKETQSGLDGAGSDSGEESLSEQGVTMDQAGQAARAMAQNGLGPVTPSIGAIDMLDAATRAIALGQDHMGTGALAAGRRQSGFIADPNGMASSSSSMQNQAADSVATLPPSTPATFRALTLPKDYPSREESYYLIKSAPAL